MVNSYIIDKSYLIYLNLYINNLIMQLHLKINNRLKGVFAMRMARALLDYLKLNNVDLVFGIPSSTVSAIFDELCDANIKTIITKNEAGAVYSASRYSSASNKMGVCVLAGGVGVNNAVNGIADAMRNKIPLLIISGHVQRWQIGKGAIHEQDTEYILKPITKYSHTVMAEDIVLNSLKEAIEIALTPPMGPVHVSIPLDIQMMEYNVPLLEEAQYYQKYLTPNNNHDIKRACNIINENENGIILVGKGCKGCSEKIMELSQRLQWPIITTPQAKGLIPYDFPLNLGNYGFGGTDLANRYVENSNSSCLLILGSSLGEAVTKNYSSTFTEGRKVIHIDQDEMQINKIYRADVGISADLKLVIPSLLELTNKSSIIFKKSETFNDPYIKNHFGLSLRLFFEKITSMLPQNTFYVCDIGEYMNFALKYTQIPQGSSFDINMNYGATGTGVGGAVGIQLAFPNRPVAVFCGDGSFFMNGNEIFTAKEYKLPIIYFIVNNSMLGYVQHGQMYMYGRALKNYCNQRVSISSMMNAAGVRSFEIRSIDELNRIPELIRNLHGPCVIELITNGSEPAPIAHRFQKFK